jgi:hypothetical protein
VLALSPINVTSRDRTSASTSAREGGSGAASTSGAARMVSALSRENSASRRIKGGRTVGFAQQSLVEFLAGGGVEFEVERGRPRPARVRSPPVPPRPGA